MRHVIARTLVLTACAAALVFTLPQTASAVNQQAFIDSAGSSAKPSQEEYGVPASVTIAQAILESGWGDSGLAKKANNYFGMKCHDKQTGPIAVDCMETDTRECNDDECWDTTAWFRVYDSVADSFSDHGRNLHENPRYEKAFDHTDDADAFIREVHKAGYATDPKYTDKIVGLMKQYDLYRFNNT
ncbi:MAG TPA: sporangiospore maturation cell wall hydrolase GsmA [Candidatus Stackebrandtia excrementipullorum]|nr:sporangiospore maturation cell wall hydrolase GsmA [Candidatus Stackebrandtia excrementipullorum]